MVNVKVEIGEWCVKLFTPYSRLLIPRARAIYIRGPIYSITNFLPTRTFTMAPKPPRKKRDPKLASLKLDIGDAQGDIEYLKSASYFLVLTLLY